MFRSCFSIKYEVSHTHLRAATQLRQLADELIPIGLNIKWSLCTCYFVKEVLHFTKAVPHWNSSNKCQNCTVEATAAVPCAAAPPCMTVVCKCTADGCDVAVSGKTQQTLGHVTGDLHHSPVMPAIVPGVPHIGSACIAFIQQGLGPLLTARQHSPAVGYTDYSSRYALWGALPESTYCISTI